MCHMMQKKCMGRDLSCPSSSLPTQSHPHAMKRPSAPETASGFWEIVRIRESTKFPSTPQPETRDSVRRVMVNVVVPANEVAVLGGIPGSTTLGTTVFYNEYNF